MQYMGSKSKIAGIIVPILQKIIDENNIKTYAEPFTGGANVIDKIRCETKFGYDKNESLIALLSDAQLGGSNIPEDIAREDWDKWKEIYRKYEGLLLDNRVPFEDMVAIGATAFFGSFGCRGFAGGMANNTKDRNYYKQRKASLMKQAEAPLFKDITFYSLDYSLLSLESFNQDTLIYCDPPYYATKPYGYKFETDFDHKKYWNWVRECSEKCFVICSEQTFPDDFQIIWEKEVNRTNGADNNYKAIEKLGIYKYGLASKLYKS